MKKKILYGLEATSGGAFKHLIYLISHIDRNLFDITVVLSNSRKDFDEHLVQQIQSLEVEILMIPMNRRIHPINDLIAFLFLFKHIRISTYDIVHAHSSKAGALFRLAAWLNKVPLVIYTPHCFYFQGKQGLLRIIFVLLEKCLGRFCHAIVVSDHEKRVALAHQIVRPVKLININNAIDFNEYRQYKDIRKIKRQWDIPKHHFIIGAVGRLVPQKDWFTFIKAALLVLQSRDDVCFIIAGSGHLKKKLLKMICSEKASSGIKLLGHVTDISKVYSVLDLFISTSLWEGLPYAYLEAGYFKKPVVATGTFDSCSWENDFGFETVEVKKHELLAQKILELVANKKEAMLRGNQSHKMITGKYSFAHFITKHEELYLEVVKS